MIIVIQAQQNPNTPDQPPQVQLTWEGAEPEHVKATLAQMLQVLEHQFPAEGAGGGAKSRLIVPQPNVTQDINNGKQPPGLVK